MSYTVTVRWGESWGSDPDDKPEVYTFETVEEVNAFTLGIGESNGWFSYDAQIEGPEGVTQEFETSEEELRQRYYDDREPMDGDHESALASAGFGTDEDYGG